MENYSLPKRSSLPSRQSARDESRTVSRETVIEQDAVRMQAALDGLSSLAINEAVAQEPEQHIDEVAVSDNLDILDK